ncbi:monocarboxylate transporter 12-like [Strongylocentrotus purpuratus]|uniref:Monocarboxylate transporter n=1 Tax=Strongylocentrotus purpuratus TaxID=7668 RepID=A0A7M7PJY9_STRPU|nr:monocarboxylate transporter 12-like [Strongylocentrotus purpuratus]
MVGGLTGSVCLMMCSTVQTNIELAVFLFSSGLGFAMTVLPSQVSVISAFKGNYTLPFCVSAMGGGVGMMVLPLCTQKLLEIYDWRGAMLLLGGLNLHTVVSGAFLQGKVMQRVSPRDISTTSDTSTSSVSEDAALAALPLRCWRNVRALILIAYRKSGVSVLGKYPRLTYMIIVSYLHGITYAGWTIFVISNAEVKGLQEETAVFLSVVGGIGNTIGRLLPGALNFLNKDLFPSRVSFLALGVIGSVPLCLNSIATNFPTLCVFASLNGLALGTKAITKSAASVDVVPESFSSTALAFALVCSGMGELTGGWATGKIWDVTGSMDTAFLFLGCVDIVGVVILLLGMIHEKIIQLKNKTNGASGN